MTRWRQVVGGTSAGAAALGLVLCGLAIAGCANPTVVHPLPATVYRPPLGDVRQTLEPKQEKHWNIGVKWVDGQGAGAAWRDGGAEHTISRDSDAKFYPTPPTMWSASETLQTWHQYCAYGFEPEYALILRDTEEPGGMVGDCFLYPTNR